LQDHFRLPAVLWRGVGGATPRSDRGTPRSVRSSKSEPIHSTRKESNASKNSGERSAGFRAELKSGCDSATLAASLRMERNARPSIHDAPRGSQFAQFWNWDGQQSSKFSKNPNTSNGTSSTHQEVNNKIARVKEMQKLYTSGAFGQPAPASAASALPEAGAGASPTRLAPLAATASYEKPRTPEVRDRDLTAHDMAIVSKYFSSGTLHESSQSQTPGIKPTSTSDSHGLGTVVSPTKSAQRSLPTSLQHGEIQKIPPAIALLPIENKAFIGDDRVNTVASPMTGYNAHLGGESARINSPANLPVTPVRTKSTAISSPFHSDGKPSSPHRLVALTPSRQGNSTRLFSPLSHNKPGSAASGGMSPEGLLQWTASLNPADLDMW
jgi:hypothetical protein